jgi:uncharacterized protein YjbJ (UPF0337 family)
MDRSTSRSPAGERVSGNWKMFKGKLREKWGEITDDELDRVQGRREQLVGYIQQKSGRERAEVEREIDNLSRETNYRW